MRIFLYGELLNMQNLTWVLGKPYIGSMEDAILLDYSMVGVAEDMVGIVPSTLSEVKGLVLDLSDEEVSRLIKLHGNQFKLKPVTVKLLGLEQSVRAFVYSSQIDHFYNVNDNLVSKRIIAFGVSYTESDMVKNLAVKTVNTITDGKDYNWVVYNFPFFVNWLKKCNYRSDNMFADFTPDNYDFDKVLFSILSELYDLTSDEVKSIVKDDWINGQIKLSTANEIYRYYVVLKKSTKVPLPKAVTVVFSNADQTTLEKAENIYKCLDSINTDYYKLKEICDSVESTWMQNSIRYFLILYVLLNMKLPIVKIKNIQYDNIMLNVLNDIYKNYKGGGLNV